ncbi:hypothetical protein [Paenibacillus solani]|uniref:hypothetical protein n=1 Tax=Paenibacillus solani TaxID=1705565 RepID=UPI003D2CF792
MAFGNRYEKNAHDKANLTDKQSTRDFPDYDKYIEYEKILTTKLTIKFRGERKIYLDNAVSRINDIKWEEVGTIVSNEDADLACEFLRRLALFYKNECLRPQPPMFSNIAKLLGDTENELLISMYCNSRVLEFVANHQYIEKLFVFYIQLSIYVDKKPKYTEYLNVYEPLIRILERGGFFVIRPQELEIQNVKYIPLNGWFDKFVSTEPYNISEF